MKDIEKKIADTLDAEYQVLIEQNVNIAGLHAASLFSEYDQGDVKKNLERLAVIQAFSAAGLGVKYRKMVSTTKLPEDKIISLSDKENVIKVNVKYLREKSSLDDAIALMQVVHAVTFIDHVKMIVKTKDEKLAGYAQKFGWTEEIKNVVDAKENPKAYYEQNYVKSALAYGIVYADKAISFAAQALKKLQNK